MACQRLVAPHVGTGQAPDDRDLVPSSSRPREADTAARAPVTITWEDTVHAVIRHYRGNLELFDELERRADEVEQVIRGVPGFVSYSLVRTVDGGFSVGVFQDEAGTDESTRVVLPDASADHGGVSIGDDVLRAEESPAGLGPAGLGGHGGAVVVILS